MRRDIVSQMAGRMTDQDIILDYRMTVRIDQFWADAHFVILKSFRGVSR